MSTERASRCPRHVCPRRNLQKNLAAYFARIPQNLASPERFGEGTGKATRIFLKKPAQRVPHPATLPTTGQAAFTGHYFCDTKIMPERAAMEEIVIRTHAFKHGLSREQIVHAWRNAVDARQRLRDDGGLDVVVIGPDERGRMLEVTAHVGDGPVVIFHANTPPSKRALREFHIVEGGRK